MKSKVTRMTWDDFLKNNPELSGLDPMSQIDFDLASINQEDLSTLKSYFFSICKDLTIYMQLFSISEHVEELNKFNGLIFHQIEKAYLEKICLKVSTLMDPSHSRTREGQTENLSLRYFIKKTGSKLLESQFHTLYEFYESSGIKDWRNKAIAHADLKVLSGQEKIELKFEREDIERFIADIQSFIDWLDDPQRSIDHRVVLPYNSDGYAFVEKIKQLNNQK